jgi:hypothetical protein
MLANCVGHIHEINVTSNCVDCVHAVEVTDSFATAIHEDKVISTADDVVHNAVCHTDMELRNFWPVRPNYREEHEEYEEQNHNYYNRAEKEFVSHEFHSFIA